MQGTPAAWVGDAGSKVGFDSERRTPMEVDSRPPLQRSVSDVSLVNKALEYVMKLKEIFAGNQQGTYRDFLALLQEYKADRMDANGVYRQVSALFGERADLVEEFKETFLPPRLKRRTSLMPPPSSGNVLGTEMLKKLKLPDQFLDHDLLKPTQLLKDPWASLELTHPDMVHACLPPQQTPKGGGEVQFKFQ